MSQTGAALEASIAAELERLKGADPAADEPPADETPPEGDEPPSMLVSAANRTCRVRPGVKAARRRQVPAGAIRAATSASAGRERSRRP